MKKTILILSLALISAATMAQTGKKSPKVGKTESPKVASVTVPDSVKVSAAELKSIIMNFYNLVDDSSDISR